MAWAPEYVAWLESSPLYPVYLLESIVVGKFRTTATPLKLSSAWVSDEHVVAIVREGSSIDYGTLQPGTWDRSFGSATFSIAGFDPRGAVTRGTVVCLRVGPANQPISDVMHPHVWLGVVRNVTMHSGRWAIECVELVGAFANRFSEDSDQQSLFYSLGSTTLASKYDPDDAGITTIEVDSNLNAGGFTMWTGTRDTDDGFALRITPSEGGDPFYVLATTFNTGTLTFSGLTASSEDELFGTLAVPAAIGDTVEAIAYSTAHPMVIAARVLLSQADPSGEATYTPGTGTAGANGPYDMYPWAWSYGVKQFLFDEGDMEAFQALTESTNWVLLVDRKQIDGQQWLQEYLRPAGMFLATFQGSLTVRAVIHDTGQNTPGVITIDDNLITDFVSYEAWDPDSPVEYDNARVVAADGTSDTMTVYEDHVTTRPSRPRRRRDLPDVWGTAAQWTPEVADRLGPYDTRVPERIVIETRGWAAAQPGIGDLVRLTTAFLTRRTTETDSAFDATPCLMVGGGCDWFGGTCRLELIAIPRFAKVE